MNPEERELFELVDRLGFRSVISHLETYCGLQSDTTDNESEKEYWEKNRRKLLTLIPRIDPEAV